MWIVQNDVYIEFDFEDHMVYALIFVILQLLFMLFFPLSPNPQTPTPTYVKECLATFSFAAGALYHRVNEL